MRCASPRPSQLRCSPKNKNTLFPETKCFPSGPKWATLHHTKQCCIQLSYAAPYLSYAAPQELRFTRWAKLHPSELRWTLLSYAAPCLSYAAPYELCYTFWAKLQPSITTLYPSELRLTLNELRGTLKIYMSLAHRSFADPYGKIYHIFFYVSVTSVTIAERWAILYVLIIKLTKRARRRV